MGIAEQDFQSKIGQLTELLERSRVNQRDTALKGSRELTSLKKLIIAFCSDYPSDNMDLRERLQSIKHELELQKDLQSILPKLSVIERILKQDSKDSGNERGEFTATIKRSTEFLQRIPKLPSRLKQELRSLSINQSQQPQLYIVQATKLIQLYERALKISNTGSKTSQLEYDFDRDLLEKISIELQHLITELDFEGESGEQLADIRAKLLIGCNTEALLKATIRVLKLVIIGTEYERKTSEQLLDQVNQSLSGIMKSTQHTMDQSQSYNEGRKQMNRELDTLITKTSDQVDAAESLESLQSNLSPMLLEMKALAERLKHAEEKEQALIEQINYSHTQLEALSDVTQDYRRRLAEQNERILQDPLTKVLNRNAIMEQMELEYQKWIRTQDGLRLAFIDIDDFKSLNDSFGYTVGDKALKIIARTITEIIKEHAPNNGHVGRFSGEKFLIILPKMNDNLCKQVMSNIQTAISQLPFKFRNKNIQVTVSISSAALKENLTPEEMIEKLKRGLAIGKKNGTEQLTWV